MANTTYTLPQAITIIKALPRMYAQGGYSWHTNVEQVAIVAAALLKAESTETAIAEVSRQTKVAASTLHHFTNGRSTQGVIWPELRAAMTKIGVAWNVTPRERRDIEAQKDARPVAPAATAAPAPVAVAPVADPPTGKPAATLAVTQAGAVEVTSAPARATAPPAMVARPVAPMVKDPPRNWRIDPETQDILVTTTTRYAYGTPEHRRKLMEILPALGTGRGDTTPTK